MSWITVHWRSEWLAKQTTAQVLLPEVGTPPFPVFYLLHGLSDDSTIWLRRTRIELYAAKLPLIVVMPDGYRGFYTDNEQGPAYARHFGEEYPAFIERSFHARPERAARAIGGLSMGGYGALRVGLGYAERFCSVNSHSGAVGWGGETGEHAFREAARARGWPYTFVEEMKRIFGSAPGDSPHDLLVQARQARRRGTLPELLIDCGTEDPLLIDNRRLHQSFEAENIPHRYAEFPGAHTWDYWDEHVRDALAFHAKNLGIDALP